MRQRQRKWAVVLLLGLLSFETGKAAAVQDPVPFINCTLTIEGLEGNRLELKPQFFIGAPTGGYTVEMPRANNTGPLQTFIMTITLTRPNIVVIQTTHLFLMAHASAIHFNNATMKCLNPVTPVYQQWVLSDVTLSVPKFPIEQIVLMATRAEFEDLVTHVKFTWDVKANQGGLVTPAGPLLYVPPSPTKSGPLGGGGSLQPR